MHPVALTAGECSDLLLLIAALEAEPRAREEVIQSDRGRLSCDKATPSGIVRSTATF